MELKEQIKAWRDRDDLTQEEAAAKIGCSLSALTRWEQGSRKPKGMYLRRVEQVIAASERKADVS